MRVAGGVSTPRGSTLGADPGAHSGANWCCDNRQANLRETRLRSRRRGPRMEDPDSSHYADLHRGSPKWRTQGRCGSTKFVAAGVVRCEGFESAIPQAARGPGLPGGKALRTERGGGGNSGCNTGFASVAILAQAAFVCFVRCQGTSTASHSFPPLSHLAKPGRPRPRRRQLLP